MKKVYSDNKLEKFQVLGTIVRVHWNFEEYEETDDNGNTKTIHRCDEAVFNYFDKKETIIDIISQQNGPAQTLADEWEIYKNA